VWGESPPCCGVETSSVKKKKKGGERTARTPEGLGVPQTERDCPSGGILLAAALWMEMQRLSHVDNQVPWAQKKPKSERKRPSETLSLKRRFSPRPQRRTKTERVSSCIKTSHYFSSEKIVDPKIPREGRRESAPLTRHCITGKEEVQTKSPVRGPAQWESGVPRVIRGSQTRYKGRNSSKVGEGGGKYHTSEGKGTGVPLRALGRLHR